MSEGVNIVQATTDGAHDAAQTARPMRTLLICHEGADLDRVGLAHWLASFSDLAGVVVLREPKQRLWRRIRREIKRVGTLRFPDVLAFRLYYKFALAAQDRAWEQGRLEELRRQYPAPVAAPELLTDSPNSAEAEAFIRACNADIVIARCKTLLKERIFTLPPQGTFVMHPGICPEYRNAHGCFWALAKGDLTRVGMTLLRIDRGVDTGPVYGYYTYDFDELNESHARIQQRSVLDNLDTLAAKLRAVYQDEAVPLDTTGRTSATWGQPWLSKYFAWRRNARRRQRAADTATATTGAAAREGRRG
jgi:Formyl transferase